MNTVIKIMLVISLISLTGCGQLLKAYGDHVDRGDPCQTRNKKAGYRAPTWCGAADGYYSVTSNYRTGRAESITKYER